MARLVVVASPIHSAVMADGRCSTDLSEPLLTDSVRERQVVIDVERGPYQNGVRDHPSDGEEIDDGNPFEMVGAAPLSLRPANPVDPFRNDTPTWGGVYEWVKVVVLAPLVAVRLVLFGLAIAVGFVATKVALQGWKDKQSPMPAWRSRIMWITRICSRCILFAFGYHWIKRVGKPAPREVAPIVVSNHISYIEPIFFFYELFPTIVASESHDGIPFVGTIIRAMQVIYVDRFSAPSRKNAVNEIKRKASCNNFPRVLLFPEGTTTNGRFLLSFQLGAFIPGFPVQPVIVRYPHVHFDQSWGNISLAKLMFRMFTQFHNFMEVEYLPVIVPVDSKQKNAVQFAEQTGYAMAHALNAVQTSYSYGDMMLLTRASQFTKDSSIYMVEMAWAERSFNISTSEALEFLDQFFAMNPDANGRVELHDFLTSMGLSLNPLSKKIFGFFDIEKKGSITFRQFLVGSAYIRKQPLFWRACEEAFCMCNSEGTDYISVEQLTSIIEPVTSGTRDEILDRLFQLVDTNNDGSVSREAFLACLRRNPLLIAILVTCLKNTNSLEAL